MKNSQIGLAVALVLIGGVIFAIEHNKAKNIGADVPVIEVTPRTASTSGETALSTKPQINKASLYPLAKEITTPDGFINTNGQPIKIEDLVGKKVILLDIWTYSCINCQRTIPYLNAWYDKYKDKGLVIIGLHTPEFDFEKDLGNVEKAVAKFEIKYPVVLDNDYSTWNAYKNQYWPRQYLIDIDGYIVHDHIGEGDDQATEDAIRAALIERTEVLGTKDIIPSGYVNPKTVGPIDTLSVETYFGSARNIYLANGTKAKEGLQTLTLPSVIDLNKLYLEGTWNFVPEYAESTSDQASIVYHYKAKNVYLVAGSKTPVEIKVYQDDKLISTQTVGDSKLYTLVENPGMEEHTLKIKIGGKGLDAFTFTFG